MDFSDSALQNDLKVLDKSQLLDALSEAALVYNRAKDKILEINQKLAELTGYQEKELTGASLSFLMTGEQDTNPTGLTMRKSQLRGMGGEIIPVSLRVLSISKTNQIVILLFGMPAEESEIRRSLLDQEHLFDQFSMLAEVGKAKTARACLENTARVVEQLISPQALAIYSPSQPAGSHKRLLMPGYNPGPFPEKLHDDNLETTEEIQLWKSPKPPTCSLHTLAQDDGLRYLLSLPLAFNGTSLGLVLAAGLTSIPDDDDMRLLSMLATLASSMLYHLGNFESAKRSLEKIRQAVQIQHTVTDNLEEGVITLTRDLKIAEMNPSAEIMLGYASKEVFLQDADMVLIGNESLAPLYKSALESVSTMATSNLTLNTRNGKTFPAQVLCLPVILGERVTSIVLLIRDLSQTEQIVAQSRHLEQKAYLGEVSAVFAHEVKNPINSISTGLQYIGFNLKPDDPLMTWVTRLQNDCVRLTHLMNSTLTFSKPREYHFALADLSELIPSILERWAPRLTRLNIRYNFASNPAHPWVRADVPALEEVFVNLISNATQAMENTGGTLAVSINPADPSVQPPQYEIIVADSGPGIPKEFLAHIFEPFVTTKNSGTGLGLAISKRIITAHKGNIYVESFPGGTMFHILLEKAQNGAL